MANLSQALRTPSECEFIAWHTIKIACSGSCESPNGRIPVYYDYFHCTPLLFLCNYMTFINFDLKFRHHGLKRSMNDNRFTFLRKLFSLQQV